MFRSLLTVCLAVSVHAVCDEMLVSGPRGVPDTALTATSQITSAGPSRARLDTPTVGVVGGRMQMSGWRPASNSQQEYIQVDLASTHAVRGIVTQGGGRLPAQQAGDYVTLFRVSYSLDSKTWSDVMDSSGRPKYFGGNSDAVSKVTNTFQCPVFARFLRVHPLSWQHAIALRFDLMGCKLDTTTPTTTTTTTTPTTTTTTTSPLPSGFVPLFIGPVKTTTARNLLPPGFLPLLLGSTPAPASLSHGLTFSTGQGSTVSSAPTPLITASSVTSPSSLTSSGRCVTSCVGMGNGNFQSCQGCHVYITCAWGMTFDRRPCPSNLRWDDLVKGCRAISQTCTH